MAKTARAAWEVNAELRAREALGDSPCPRTLALLRAAVAWMEVVDAVPGRPLGGENRALYEAVKALITHSG